MVSFEIKVKFDNKKWYLLRLSGGGSGTNCMTQSRVGVYRILKSVSTRY